MRIIMDGLKEGSITAYDISATDEFLVPLTYQEVIARQVDTIHQVLQRSFPPYEEFDTVIFTDFDPTKVKRIRMKEEIEVQAPHRHQVDINININLEEYRNQVNQQSALPPVKSDKLKTSLSVSQLVYAFRVFNEMGLINVKNQMEALL